MSGLEKWTERALSTDTTRSHLTKTHAIPALGQAAMLVATDGHRLHAAPVDEADYVLAEQPWWLQAPIEAALGSATRRAAVGTLDELRAKCSLAIAVAAQRWHEASAEAYSEAIAKGRAPARDALPDREAPCVWLTGDGKCDDVCVNANYLLDAISCLRRGTVEVLHGGAMDPVLVRRSDGAVAVIMPMRIDADERPEWPMAGMCGTVANAA